MNSHNIPYHIVDCSLSLLMSGSSVELLALQKNPLLVFTLSLIPNQRRSEKERREMLNLSVYVPTIFSFLFLRDDGALQK